MYWSPAEYPILAGRTRTERDTIVRAAVKEHDRWSGGRYMALVVAVSVLGISASGSGLGAWLSAAPISDWRKWAPLAALGALVYGVYLWEVNGPTHTAVEKYLAAKSE